MPQLHRTALWRSFAVMLAALFVALALAGPASAATTGTISGTVVDAATKKPLPGAIVTASSPSGRGTATSDANGFYNIYNLAPDTYTGIDHDQGLQRRRDVGHHRRAGPERSHRSAADALAADDRPRGGARREQSRAAQPDRRRLQRLPAAAGRGRRRRRAPHAVRRHPDGAGHHVDRRRRPPAHPRQRRRRRRVGVRRHPDQRPAHRLVHDEPVGGRDAEPRSLYRRLQRAVRERRGRRHQLRRETRYEPRLRQHNIHLAVPGIGARRRRRVRRRDAQQQALLVRLHRRQQLGPRVRQRLPAVHQRAGAHGARHDAVDDLLARRRRQPPLAADRQGRHPVPRPDRQPEAAVEQGPHGRDDRGHRQVQRRRGDARHGRDHEPRHEQYGDPLRRRREEHRAAIRRRPEPAERERVVPLVEPRQDPVEPHRER